MGIFKRSKKATEYLKNKGANIDEKTGNIQNLDDNGNIDDSVKFTRNLGDGSGDKRSQEATNYLNSKAGIDINKNDNNLNDNNIDNNLNYTEEDLNKLEELRNKTGGNKALSDYLKNNGLVEKFKNKFGNNNNSQKSNINQENNINDQENNKNNINSNNNNQNIENNNSNNNQNTIDYKNWTVDEWKQRGSKEEELEDVIENKYNTIATKNDDGSYTAIIGDTKYKWIKDKAGNPIKTIVGKIGEEEKNQEALNYLFDSGSSDEVKMFLSKNPNFSTEEIKYKLENKIKSENQIKKIKKYSNYTNEQLYDAVKKGEIVPGSDTFNQLPQANEFYKYLSTQLIIDSSDDNFDYEEFNNSMDLEKYVKNTIKDFFDYSAVSNIYKEFENNSEYQTSKNNINSYQKKIAELTNTKSKIEDEVEREMGGASETTIALEKANRLQALNNEIILYQNYISSEANNIDMLKDDLGAKIGIIQYEDSMKQKQYEKAYQEYSYNRGKMDQYDLLRFQEENKKLTEERSQKYAKELAEFNKKLSEDNLGGGVYKDDGKGNLVYIKNGKQISVLNGLGETVLTDSDADYTYEIKYNDGIYTAIGKPKKKGLKLTYETFTVDGDTIGTPMQIQTAIQKCRIEGQCGEGVNDYLQKFGLNRIFGNSYENKKSQINSDIPVLGGIAVWNPEQTEYGHVGIVTGIDGEMLEITDWNWEGDEKQATHKVPRSQIEFGGGYYNPPSGKSKDKYSEEDEALVKGIMSGYAELPAKNSKTYNKISSLLQKRMEEKLEGSTSDRAYILKSALFKKELDQGGKEAIQKIETVKYQLKNLESILKNVETGPILGKISELNPYDGEAQLALAEIVGVTPNIARGIFGEVGVLTDADIKNYQKTLPTLTSTKEKNELVLKFMRDLLSRTYEKGLVIEAKAGRNVSRFLEEYDSIIKEREEKEEDKVGLNFNYYSSKSGKTIDFNKYIKSSNNLVSSDAGASIWNN